MYRKRGYPINRFDETFNGDGVSEAQLEEKLNSLQTEFSTGAKKLFEKIEENLKTHLKSTDALVKNISVSPSYISLGNKRIVRVANAIDEQDVVTKKQVDDVIGPATKLIKIMHPVKSTTPGVHDSIEIKGHRRISKVSRSKESYDVVVKVELDELNNKLVDFQTTISNSLNTLATEINELKGRTNASNTLV